jgi:hypothetical protein
VSKRKASSYRSGRSPDWLKSKAKCLNKAFSSARVMFSRSLPRQAGGGDRSASHGRRRTITCRLSAIISHALLVTENRLAKTVHRRAVQVFGIAGAERADGADLLAHLGSRLRIRFARATSLRCISGLMDPSRSSGRRWRRQAWSVRRAWSTRAANVSPGKHSSAAYRRRSASTCAIHRREGAVGPPHRQPCGRRYPNHRGRDGDRYAVSRHPGEQG